MKLRLHSVLALGVGWRLISPIGDPAKPGVLPPKTPLSQWRNLGTFDSSDNCQKALSALRASFEQDTRREITAWRQQRDNSQVNRAALQAAAAQAVAERSLCIASDDPRLKKTRSEGHLSSQPQKGDSAGLRASTEPRNQKGHKLATPTAGRRDAPHLSQRTPTTDHPTSASTVPSPPTTVAAVPPAPVEPSTRVDLQPRSSSKAVHSTEPNKPVTIASAGNLTFWRLTPGGVIARSTDGVHWQPLNSGTTNDLFAGAAPSAEICWVVGRGGTVLRTTDGEQWQAIASPTDADLVRVAASDELSATVFAGDGRQFTTQDGGLSWSSAPGRSGGTM